MAPVRTLRVILGRCVTKVRKMGFSLGKPKLMSAQKADLKGDGEGKEKEISGLVMLEENWECRREQNRWLPKPP